MQWQDLIGHEQPYSWFKRAIMANRLASSFLFVGPEGIGKRTFARLLAKSLLCQHGYGPVMQPCGSCEDCVQVDASTHPDLLQVSKPHDKASIPVELLIGEREKRMREGLCHDISLRPYSGRRKVAILDDADCLNAEGANSLLKTLEEPPVDSLLILIGTNLQRQLPTIRSRCQAIIFRALNIEQLAKLLLNNQVPSMDTAQDLASMSGGSLTEASLLADPELHSFREKLLGLLSSSTLPMQELAKSCGGVVDAAGKDSRLKRERLKMLIRIAATFYRGLALRQHANSSSQPPVGDQALNQAVAQAVRHWPAGPVAATACWQRCLLAIEQVDRNANQASLLECLAADLAQISST